MELRKTGIPELGDMAWGSHACIFYGGAQDLLDILVPYFQTGLENNEFCLWAVSEPLTVSEALSALNSKVPDFKEHRAQDSIAVISRADWYLQGGHFDAKRVKKDWNKQISRALKGGYSGVRAAGDTSWLDGNSWTQFVQYEEELSGIIADQPIIVLCTYPLRDSSAEDFADVMSAHDFTLARRRGTTQLFEHPPANRREENARQARRAVAKLDLLTAREREVLERIVLGATSKEIAFRLKIAESTVQVYRSRIMMKTRTRNVAELVSLALSGGVEKSARGSRKSPGRFASEASGHIHGTAKQS